MVATVVKIGWGLTRLDTSLLVFLVVLLPAYFDTGDFYGSFAHALPVLTICMCGFVINDLSDIEKDRENHPHRPLPSGLIGEVEASVIYFTLLGISLLFIKLYVSPDHVFLYILLLICLINYNYVVAYTPKLKNIYVASVGVIPVLIASALTSPGKSTAAVAPSLFLFLFGRELLMDVQDAGGDSRTLAAAVGPGKSEAIGFAAKLAGSLWLFTSVQTISDTVAVSALVAADVTFLSLWRINQYRRTIIHAMKLQLLIGIAYLIL